LVNDARSSGLQFETVAVAASRLTSQTEEGLLAQRLEREGIDVIEASDAVFDVLSPVNSPSGIVAIAGRKGVTPQRSVRSRTPLSWPRLMCKNLATWVH
jgi:tRNA G18 (ribose-2'-O)-methylase SpoU